MTPRFRPTVWPGGEVPLPPIPVQHVRDLGNGWLHFDGPVREVDVPADFYLREMAATRPRSDDDVVAFVSEWGRCCDLDYRDRPTGFAWRTEFVDPRLHERLGGNGDTPSLRSQMAETAGISDEWRTVVHVEEVKDRLDASSWLAARMIEWQEGVERDEDVWELFGEQLNAALSAFQVRVTTPSGTSVALPQVTAFSVAALQLLNDLALQTPLRHCGNVRCPYGGVFTRQRGRAQYGQHRTSGTKYCSSTCARAQGERERRRRQTKGDK